MKIILRYTKKIGKTHPSHTGLKWNGSENRKIISNYELIPRIKETNIWLSYSD